MIITILLLLLLSEAMEPEVEQLLEISGTKSLVDLLELRKTFLESGQLIKVQEEDLEEQADLEEITGTTSDKKTLNPNTIFYFSIHFRD